EVAERKHAEEELEVLVAQLRKSLMYSNLMGKIVKMLDSNAWPDRAGAAMALISMPDGPPRLLLPKLCGLINDTRGEESWPQRLFEETK
ncbi:MAG: hypothetical protein GY850_38565, partial [bacterium]|nr:hypothetical protein [bacterium]